MKKFAKVLSILLCLAMAIGMIATMSFAAEETATVVTDAKTLAIGDQIVILNQDGTFALGAISSNSKFRTQVAATAADGKVTLNENIVVLTLQAGTQDGTFALKASDGYLTAQGSKNELHTKAEVDAKGSWTISITDGIASIHNIGADAYYLQYNSNENQERFSSYKNTQNDVVIYKLDNGGSGDVTPPAEPEEPTLTVVDIATALAGSKGDKFMVKGVVTLIDGSNLYVQDATGAICVRVSGTLADVALGDTVIGTGTRDTYNGLPQLGSSTYEKSEGLTLSAKETTIDAMTTADIATYVKINGLEVTEIYDKNGEYAAPNITAKDANGNEIQIYKAVVDKDGDGNWTIKVGDIINVNAAVGVYKTTLQLRNTLSSEITIAPASTWEPCPYNDGLHIGICDAEGKCGWCGAEGIPAEGFKQIDHKYTGNDEYYHRAQFEITANGHIATRHCEYCDATVVEEERAHNFKDGVCECGAEEVAPTWEPCPYNDGLHIGICDAEGKCGWCGAEGIPAEGFLKVDHKYTGAGADEYYANPSWEYDEEGHIATRHCEYCDETVVEEKREHKINEETGLCECGYGATTEEPEQIEKPILQTNPVAGKGYLFGLYQANKGQTLFFTGEMDGYYLAVSNDPNAAVEVFIEEVEGGYKLYFMNGSDKTYIDIVPRENAEGKVSIVLVAEGTAVYTYDSERNTFVTNVVGKDWYLGTYGDYTTISASEIRYIEDTTVIGVSQFPAGMYLIQDVPAGTGDITVSILVGLMAISAIGAAAVVCKKKEN